MNAYPYASGHVLVMPLRHVGVAGRPDGGRVRRAVVGHAAGRWPPSRRPTSPTGSTWAPTSAGRPGRASRPIVHLHVLPRWSGDTNFMTVGGRDPGHCPRRCSCPGRGSPTPGPGTEPPEHADAADAAGAGGGVEVDAVTPGSGTARHRAGCRQCRPVRPRRPDRGGSVAWCAGPGRSSASWSASHSWRSPCGCCRRRAPSSRASARSSSNFDWWWVRARRGRRDRLVRLLHRHAVRAPPGRSPACRRGRRWSSSPSPRRPSPTRCRSATRSPRSTASAGSAASGPTTRWPCGRWPARSSRPHQPLARRHPRARPGRRPGRVVRPGARPHRHFRGHALHRVALRLRAAAPRRALRCASGPRSGSPGGPAATRRTDRPAMAWMTAVRLSWGQIGSHRHVGDGQLAPRLRLLRHDVRGHRRAHPVGRAPPCLRRRPAGRHAAHHAGRARRGGGLHHRRPGRLRRCRVQHRLSPSCSTASSASG